MFSEKRNACGYILIYILGKIVAYCIGGCYKTPKVRDLIKEFNAIERVRDGPVAHPQDAQSTLFLSLISVFVCVCACSSLLTVLRFM